MRCQGSWELTPGDGVGFWGSFSLKLLVSLELLLLFSLFLSPFCFPPPEKTLAFPFPAFFHFSLKCWTCVIHLPLAPVVGPRDQDLLCFLPEPLASP